MSLLLHRDLEFLPWPYDIARYVIPVLDDHLVDIKCHGDPLKRVIGLNHILDQVISLLELARVIRPHLHIPHNVVVLWVLLCAGGILGNFI